jgi:predicted dehydrogenase
MKRFKRPRDIKIGVIGYGGAFNMGRHHLELAVKAGMSPTAVAEIDPERVRLAMEEFPGIEGYNSVTTMLKRSAVDLVVLITPHNTHAKLGLQCLRAGRHVISEKPLAITTAECDALIREAGKRELLLSTFHNRHWDGCILEALHHIKKEKAIGDVYRIEAHMGAYGQPGDWWRSSKTISGGILYDWGVHLLEYSLQLIRSEIIEVSGFSKTGFWAPKTRWKKDTTEDSASAVVRFKNGAWLNLTISALEANAKPGWLEISGTKGSYVFDGKTFSMTRMEGGNTHIVKGKNRADKREAFYKNIAARLTRGTRLVITPEWSRRPIHILDLACRSAAQGKALKAKYG